MTAITETELKQLIKDLKEDPENPDLINAVAIGYFENHACKAGNEDYDYFEKAYRLKKTVKSTHNFAWFLYFEWGGATSLKKAFDLQRECLKRSPTTFYPYYQYGYMLLEQGEYEEAIRYLDRAYRLENRRDISHNIGYCYFQLRKYKTAEQYFSGAVTEADVENRSLYNLALTAFKSNNFKQLRSIADSLSSDMEQQAHKAISGYEAGQLYFLLKDYRKATACLRKQGMGGIDLMDWTDLSYSLYRTAPKTWKEQMAQSIRERTLWIEEIETGHKDWDEYSEEEKQERLKEFQADVNARQAIMANGITAPTPDIHKNLLTEPCGCLLFDCKRHGNRKNDD